MKDFEVHFVYIIIIIISYIKCKRQIKYFLQHLSFDNTQVEDHYIYI